MRLSCHPEVIGSNIRPFIRKALERYFFNRFGLREGMDQRVDLLAIGPRMPCKPSNERIRKGEGSALASCP
jgi:hypothetical protein